ncbi:AraC family transcriptional regulator [Niallia sp. JL1B1071]|uniref:AraC family transcriptional regulator n=1 Tax=Niallia tiangongensis TaxID=3237105 RepID=UPI0037DD5391
MEIRKREGFLGERHVILPTHTYKEVVTSLPVKTTYITKIGFFPKAKYHYAERALGSEENILLICLDGNGTIEIDNSLSIHLNSGEAFCIPAKKNHRYFADKKNPWSIMWFHFHTECGELYNLETLQKVHIDSIERLVRIQNNFAELLDLSEKETSFSNLLCSSNYILLILTDVYLTREEPIDKQNKLLQQCIDYIHQNYDKNISLDELANIVEISPSHLSAIFKKYTQKSPIDYLIQHRIEMACMYLKLTELKLYEIAHKVGYQDSFYFSRLFKKNTGNSPKKYKDQMKKVGMNNLIKK